MILTGTTWARSGNVAYLKGKWVIKTAYTWTPEMGGKKMRAIERKLETTALLKWLSGE